MSDSQGSLLRETALMWLLGEYWCGRRGGLTDPQPVELVTLNEKTVSLS